MLSSSRVAETSPRRAVYTPVECGAAAKRKGRSLPQAGLAVEGCLDTTGVFVVAHGVPELAFGDGGVPAVGPVAVAALEGAHGVYGVAQSVDELEHLVGLPGEEPLAALGQPADLWPRLPRAEDQLGIPLYPQSVHLERPRQDAQGPQRERIVSVKPERCFKEPLEIPFAQVLVAGTEGEELLVGVRPEASEGGPLGIQPGPSEYL